MYVFIYIKKYIIIATYKFARIYLYMSISTHPFYTHILTSSPPPTPPISDDQIPAGAEGAGPTLLGATGGAVGEGGEGLPLG